MANVAITQHSKIKFPADDTNDIYTVLVKDLTLLVTRQENPPDPDPESEDGEWGDDILTYFVWVDDDYKEITAETYIAICDATKDITVCISTLEPYSETVSDIVFECVKDKFPTQESITKIMSMVQLNNEIKQIEKSVRDIFARTCEDPDLCAEPILENAMNMLRKAWTAQKASKAIAAQKETPAVVVTPAQPINGPVGGHQVTVVANCNESTKVANKVLPNPVLKD